MVFAEALIIWHFHFAGIRPDGLNGNHHQGKPHQEAMALSDPR